MLFCLTLTLLREDFCFVVEVVWRFIAVVLIGMSSVCEEKLPERLRNLVENKLSLLVFILSVAFCFSSFSYDRINEHARRESMISFKLAVSEEK